MASSGRDARRPRRRPGGRRGILLPYQRRYVSDPAPLKIWLASRQVGKSFSLAMEAVMEALRARSANLILSASERQSQEVMKKVHTHLRCLRAISGHTVHAGRETREEVELPGGSRVISLPANPDTVRGFSGNVFLDEFAFHQDAREIWRAMYPAVTRGYKVRVASTPNGKQNMFYDLWSGRTGLSSAFSRHRTTIHDARAEGLEVDIEALKRGIMDPLAWAQEFECAFLDEATAFLTYEMIAHCEDEGARTEFGGEALESQGPEAQLYLGVDVGRHRDLTVFWLLTKVGDVLWTREVKELSKSPFREQKEVLFSYLDGSLFSSGGYARGTEVPLARGSGGYTRGTGDRLEESSGGYIRGTRGPLMGEVPLVRRCSIDASGIGAQLAEEARERFGARVEPVVFGPRVKEDLALVLRRSFEERTVRIPPVREIREDLHSVRRLTTVAGNVRYDAARTEGSHADRFWALALALHAAEVPQSRVFYERVAGRAEGFRRNGCW
jgi:phage FluMu gp28-like protein